MERKTRRDAIISAEAPESYPLSLVLARLAYKVDFLLRISAGVFAIAESSKPRRSASAIGVSAFRVFARSDLSSRYRRAALV